MRYMACKPASSSWHSNRIKNSKRNNQRKRQKSQPSSPPQYTSSISVSHRFRFKAAAAGNENVSPSDLLLLMAMTTLNATPNLSFGIATRVKVNKIQIWGPMAADLVPVTVYVDWVGSTTNIFSGRSNKVMDTSMSASQAARISSRPPKNSICSSWLPTSAQTLFEIGYPANAIIDLDLSFTLLDDTSEAHANIATNLVSTAGIFGCVAIGDLEPIGLVQL